MHLRNLKAPVEIHESPVNLSPVTRNRLVHRPIGISIGMPESARHRWHSGEIRVHPQLPFAIELQRSCTQRFRDFRDIGMRHLRGVKFPNRIGAAKFGDFADPCRAQQGPVVGRRNFAARIDQQTREHFCDRAFAPLARLPSRFPCRAIRPQPNAVHRASCAFPGLPQAAVEERFRIGRGRKLRSAVYSVSCESLYPRPSRVVDRLIGGGDGKIGVEDDANFQVGTGVAEFFVQRREKGFLAAWQISSMASCVKRAGRTENFVMRGSHALHEGFADEPAKACRQKREEPRRAPRR